MSICIAIWKTTPAAQTLHPSRRNSPATSYDLCRTDNSAGAMKTTALRTASILIILVAICTTLIATDDATTGHTSHMGIEGIISLALIWAGAACWRRALPDRC